MKQMIIRTQTRAHILSQFFPLTLISFIISALVGCAQFSSDNIPLVLLLVAQSAANDDGTGSTSTGISTTQSGTYTMAATSGSVTVTAVDMSKSFLVCQHTTQNSDPDYKVSCKLSSTTQIDFTSNSNNSQIISWYLMEFSSGATVQRGSQAIANGNSTRNVTITSVDRSKAFVLITQNSNLTPTTDERGTFTATLTSSTNLALTRNSTGTTATVEWQVIELDTASVQYGNLSITGTTTATATLTSVTTANTFLVFSVAASNASAGVDNEYFTRGTLTDATTLTFTRENAANSVDLSWFAVEMSGATVQKGTASDANTAHLTLDGSLSTAIDTNYSFPLISSSINFTGSGEVDAGSYNATFADTSTLRMTREGPENHNATVDWFVVQLTP